MSLDAGSTITITDGDDTKISGAVLEISSGYTSGDLLALPTGTSSSTGISGIWNSSTRQLTLSGTTSLANYQTALRAVTYSSTSDDPTASSSSRRISIQVTDANRDGNSAVSGRSTSNQAGVDISLTATADAPVLTPGSSNPSYTEAGTAAFLAPTLTLSDGDDTQLTQAVVRISTGFVSGDQLSFTAASGISGSYDDSSGTLTLKGPATLANYRSVLRSIRYSSSAADLASGSRTISWSVLDANSDGLTPQWSTAATSTLNVVGVNKGPVLSGLTGSAISYWEGESGVALNPDLVLTDTDSSQISAASISISAGFTAGDVLSLPININGISASYNPGTGVLSLSGTASLGAYQQALRAISYSTTSANPTLTSTSRTISMQVTDVGNPAPVQSTVATSSLIIAVVDTTAPTATIVVADTALKAAETSAVTITFSEAVTDFTNADLNVANGTLSAVSSSDGGTTWSATFTATATQDDNTNVITLNNAGIKDLNGNTGSLTTDSNNYAIDVTAPTISAAKVNGKQLTITFKELSSGLEQLSLGGKFTVSVGTQVIDATTISLDAIAGTLSLSLATAVLSGDQPTLAYSQTGPSSAAPIQDKAGNLLASFSGLAINNEAGDGNGLKNDAEDGIVSALKPSAKPITRKGKTYYDTNGDGRTDIVKVGSQLFGDLNGDGIPDANQGNVASIGYINKANYQASNDSNPLTNAPTSSLVSIVAGSKADQPDQRLTLSTISVESPTENSRPNPFLAATTIYPMVGSATVAGSRVRADRTWDSLQFTVGFDPITGVNLDVDKTTSGTQVDILIDISRSRTSVGFFNAYLKWDPSANANKGGWINFMRQQGKGDGAEYLDLNRDGFLDVIRLRLTDNGLGDTDNRVGFISDPGMPAFITPPLTAKQRCFVNLFSSRGSNALAHFS